MDYMVVLWIEARKLSVFQQNRRLYRKIYKPVVLVVHSKIKLLQILTFGLVTKQIGLAANGISRQIR